MASSPQTDLHQLAVSAEESLVHLAIGLAHAGASPQTVNAIKSMTGAVRKVIVALGPGADAQEQAESPAEEAAETPAQEQAETAPQQPTTMDAATAHLHHAMQTAAAARQGGH